MVTTKITGTDLASTIAMNRKPKPTVQSRSAIRRPVFGRGPVRGVPTPTLPPVGISQLGTAIQPGHVIQNAHSGTPDVMPWTPLVSNLRHRVGPYEKLPPWKYMNDALRPNYAKSESDFIPPPKLEMLTLPQATSGTGTGAGGGGGFGGGGGGGAVGGGVGGGRLK